MSNQTPAENHEDETTLASDQPIAVSQTTIDAAVNKLVTQWGYRLITELIEAYYQHLGEECEPYLAILQTPEGGPVYCRDATRLCKELDRARTTGIRYTSCPAPRPEEQMWLVIGNFETEEDR
jgi:hypothetical protein